MKVFIEAHLHSRGSEAHDNAGLVFCIITCADGQFFTDAFDEGQVVEKDDVVLVPAEADFVPGPATALIPVKPAYTPYLWGTRQRPPEEILVAVDKVVMPDG